MKRVLVLGATGALGRPVATSLADSGWKVRVLVRSAEKASHMLGAAVEVVEGDATEREHLRRAMIGCDAVHVTLPTESELVAVQHVTDLASAERLERISYVSGTSVREDNRWFELVDVKMRAEEVLRSSGVPHTVFCPTWVMEVLPNFLKRGKAVVIEGKRPPRIHFLAAADFGRMVANAYDDGRTLGKRLYVHGPEGITLHCALQTFLTRCHPQLNVMRLELWQARLISRVMRQMDQATRLIGFFDKVGELGDPTEANTLLGEPRITLHEWIDARK